MEHAKGELELTPEQPPEVVEQIAAALARRDPGTGPDPWWQAGVREQLEE